MCFIEYVQRAFKPASNKSKMFGVSVVESKYKENTRNWLLRNKKASFELDYLLILPRYSKHALKLGFLV